MKRKGTWLFRLLLLICFFFGGSCAGSGPENDTGSPHDGDDDVDDDGIDDSDDDSECSFAPQATVTVQPPSEGNLLARQLIVATDSSCSLSGMVTAAGEPGFGPSSPVATDNGHAHSLWFYGLLENRKFDYTIYVKGCPELVVAHGAFETPALPFVAPRPFDVDDSHGADRRDWIAVVLNTIEVPAIQIVNYLVIMDREGRLRFFHELGEHSYAYSLIRFSNGDLATNETAIAFIRPNGFESRLELHLTDPYFSPTHHSLYIEDYDSDMAVTLFNQLGPGLECDLVTPTDMAVGDGIVEVDRHGNELWRWSMFDHQDELPPDQMQPWGCEKYFWGVDKYDWTHANTIVPVPEQDAYLVSIRHLMRLIKVDRATGEILWQMGEGLDFQWIGDEPEADQWFRFQHDAHWLPGERILLFDNGNCRYDPDCGDGPYSRALELQIDEAAMTVEKVWEFRVPFAEMRGAVCRHENGNTLIGSGWRTIGEQVAEADPDGNLVWTAKLPLVQQIAATIYYPAFWNYDATLQ